MFTRSVVKPAGGLTLVEVLVACALGIIVLTLLVQTLVPTMAASRKAADRVDLHQRAALLGERITHDLRGSSRAGVGVFPAANRQQISIHPRQQDSGLVAWQSSLRVYDWQNQSVTGFSAALSAAPAGPLVPSMTALEALTKQLTMKVEGVENFNLTLDPGPSARLDMKFVKGDQSMEFRRMVFLRNGTD